MTELEWNTLNKHVSYAIIKTYYGNKTTLDHVELSVRANTKFNDLWKHSRELAAYVRNYKLTADQLEHCDNESEIKSCEGADSKTYLY